MSEINSQDKLHSRVLMACLFATGLSGIVAEYILATLATYFLGNSVLQWTMILSCMLFAMGFGSRVSKYFDKNILELFVGIEFLLSILTSFSALLTYGLMGFTNYIGFIIYVLAILIGFLIGMEIPLVTRINGRYENLKFNISSVMEKDYYGSLIGGIFFAFVGLPYLGLTFTPFVLGGVNLIVAFLLIVVMKDQFTSKWKGMIQFVGVGVLGIIVAGLIFAKPIVLFGEQQRYVDKVVFTQQTKYQKITVTQFKDNYWLYLNEGKQLSTFDEWLYHEPLVHPVMKLSKQPKHVLIVGAGDGCAIREVLKYEDVDSIYLVDLDPEMTNIGANHPIFTEMNDSAYHHPKVKVFNGDAFNWLEKTNRFFDVIIADFPDPKTIELNRLYSKEFYQLCHRHLRPNGVMVTQATSPYYTTTAFRGIDVTMTAAGFNTIPLHNHVYTFGEWGWVIGAKSIPKDQLKPILQEQSFEDVDVRWITKDAMSLLSSFGKDIVLDKVDSIEVNAIHNPVLYKYYRDGNWSIYFNNY